MNRPARFIAIILMLAVALVASGAPGRPAVAQTDTAQTPEIGNLFPLAEIAALLKVEENGQEKWTYYVLGSGSVVTIDGQILTDKNVADLDALAQQLSTIPEVKEVDRQVYLILMPSMPDESSTTVVPQPVFFASKVASNDEVGAAVLQIRAGLDGKEIPAVQLRMQSVSLGSSSQLTSGAQVSYIGYVLDPEHTAQVVPANVTNVTQGTSGPDMVETSASVPDTMNGGLVMDAQQVVGMASSQAPGQDFNTFRSIDVIKAALAGSGQGGTTPGGGGIIGGNTDPGGSTPTPGASTPTPGGLGSPTPAPTSTPEAQPTTQGGGGILGGNGGQQTMTDGVTFTGQVVDATSGQPLSGATFVILKEGIDFSTFTGDQSEFHDVAVTDANGNFFSVIPVKKGVGYSMAFVRDGYAPVAGNGITVPADFAESVMNFGVVQMQAE